MKTRIRSIAVALSWLMLGLVALAPLAEAQPRQPVVNVKYQFALVTRSTTGLFWATANASSNFNTAMIRIVPTGSPTGCVVKVYTGPTAALATITPDAPNTVITCTSAVNKVVSNLDAFFNAELTTLSGGSSPTVTIYVTLTNMPGRFQVSSGTDGFKSVLDGVGALGAGVVQTGQVSTLSAAVSNTTVTEVVAAPAAGTSIYIRALIVTKSVATTGAVTLTYGTGTNCATGGTTLLVLAAAASSPLPAGVHQLGILVPAAKALCLSTEAAGTEARVLTN